MCDTESCTAEEGYRFVWLNARVWILGGCRVTTDKDGCSLGSGNKDVKTKIVVVLLLHAAQERNYSVHTVRYKY
jgi:hypothetical protein